MRAIPWRLRVVAAGLTIGSIVPMSDVVDESLAAETVDNCDL